MESFKPDEVVGETAVDVLELMGNDPQFQHLKRLPSETTVAEFAWDTDILFPKAGTKRSATGEPTPGHSAPTLPKVILIESSDSDSDMEDITPTLNTYAVEDTSQGSK